VIVEVLRTDLVTLENVLVWQRGRKGTRRRIPAANLWNLGVQALGGTRLRPWWVVVLRFRIEAGWRVLRYYFARM
jgi:hypothetical protein